MTVSYWRDFLNLLVAADLPKYWRIAWLLLFTALSVVLFAGTLVVVQLVIDELHVWIARVRTRIALRQQRQRSTDDAVVTAIRRDVHVRLKAMQGKAGR